MTPSRLVFASRNPGKLTELRILLDGTGIDVVSIGDLAPDLPDVVEDGETFFANAAKKARAVAVHTGLPALADDSGLEVDALGGAPGVHSARYAGGHGDDEANNDKLLEALTEVPDERRSARFRSVLVVADPAGALGEEVLTAEGTCDGVILRARRGNGGFGYDPLFYVPHLGATFAELGVGSKNEQSHRARAMQALRPLLLQYFRVENP